MKKIFFIGDSLAADYNIIALPQVGYGSILREYKADDIVFINLARQGCSTKSFLAQGRFKIVEDSISEGDLLLVEFGNNDEKINDPLRYTNKNKDFIDNLKYFYTTASNNNALCIFITSPTRCKFENNQIIDTHLGYPEAIVNFCNNNGYLCIDLNELTKKLYNYIGEKEALKYHLVYDKGIHKRFINGSDDTSHYNLNGAKMIVELLLRELKNKFDKYYDYFIDYE